MVYHNDQATLTLIHCWVESPTIQAIFGLPPPRLGLGRFFSNLYLFFIFFTSYIHNTQTYKHYNRIIITVLYNTWPVCFLIRVRKCTYFPSIILYPQKLLFPKIMLAKSAKAYSLPVSFGQSTARSMFQLTLLSRFELCSCSTK